MNNMLLNKVWDAIDAYAEAMADGSLEEPTMKIHLVATVNEALYDLLKEPTP